MRFISLLAASALALTPHVSPGKESPAAAAAAASVESADEGLAPFPAAKTISQSAMIGGRRLTYDVTVGALPMRDEKGKLLGEVVYTAYRLTGGRSRRPVTFSFNGGPGAASAYLNFGILGPKVVSFGKEGDYASGSSDLHDNPNSWLAFTDLVFIDPVGTGFSRARSDDDAAVKKAFFTADGDIRYLSRVIYDWLQSNGRMTSDKYLIGESYGGYRVPRIARYLQTEVGIGVSGITMVSPYLDPSFIGVSRISPLPLMARLPTMAAANFEKQGRVLDQTSMGPVEDYMKGDFLRDYFAGPGDVAATDRLVAKVAEFTGVDPVIVRRAAGRLDSSTFIRELHRDRGAVGSFYDSNVTAPDPFPLEPTGEHDDPILASSAPFASAMSDFVVNQVGWKVEGRYYINNYEVNRIFERDRGDAAVADLRKAVATDPAMHATIVHGWNDLATPYFVSKLLIAQMPSAGGQDRVKLHLYPGGHMFYARPGSAAAFVADMRGTYR